MNLWREMLRPPRDRPVLVSLLCWLLVAFSAQTVVVGLGFAFIGAISPPFVTPANREWLGGYYFLFSLRMWAWAAFESLLGTAYLLIGSGMLRLRRWARSAAEIGAWLSAAFTTVYIPFFAINFPPPPAEELPTEFRAFFVAILIFSGIVGIGISAAIALYLRRPKVRQAFRPI